MAGLFAFTAGEIASIWRDFTNSVDFGVSGTSVVVNALISNSNQTVLVGYITPATDIEVFVKIDFVNGLPDVDSLRSWATIEEV